MLCSLQLTKPILEKEAVIDFFFWEMQTLDGKNLRGPVDVPEAGKEPYAWRRADKQEVGFV